MKFSDLRKMTLLEFLDQSPQRAGFWFFLHIPKTAGSSFATELSSAMAPYYNINVDYTRTDIPYLDRLATSVDFFLSRPDLQAFDLPPGRPSFIARVLGVDIGRLRVGQARRARSPRIAQAPEALLLEPFRPVRNAA